MGAGATPLKVDRDLGITLYEPTATNAKYCITFYDPDTGARCHRTRVDRDDALELYAELEALLDHARQNSWHPPRGRRTLRGPDRTCDALFGELVEHWRRNSCAESTIRKAKGRYAHRVRDQIGDLEVRARGRSNRDCATIIGQAWDDGLKPATVQSLGALLRRLVTHAHDLGWMPPSLNPMRNVRYVDNSGEQGASARYVPESERPTRGAVEALLAAYDALADTEGIPWLAERAATGAFGGLRPSEQDAARINDLRPDLPGIYVDQTATWLSGDGTQELLWTPTKNHKRRTAPLPISWYRRLQTRADALRAAGHADDALLFADPDDPSVPLDPSRHRRLFIKAALNAGWEAVTVERSPTAERHQGPDRRPRHVYYSLRHHSVGWLNDVAGLDWSGISIVMGSGRGRRGRRWCGCTRSCTGRSRSP